MWQVLRRYQNEEYRSAAAQDAASLDDGSETMVLRPNIPANDTHPATTATQRSHLAMRTIMLHQTRPDPRPLDPLVLTEPFDGLIYKKLARTLAHENVVMRRSAIEMLLTLYAQKGEHVVNSIKVAGMLDALSVSLKDPDDDIRTQVCMALAAICRTAVGQQAILGAPAPTTLAEGTACSHYNNSYISKFLDVLDDTNNDVVAEGLRVLEAAHVQHNDMCATKHLLKLDCMKHYTRKIRDRHDDVTAAACAAFAKSLDVKEAFVHALDAGVMEALTHVMATRCEATVLQQAAEATAKLCVQNAGKRSAFSHKTLAAVLPHIMDDDVGVRTAMAAALATLTIYVPARQQALELGVVDEISKAIVTEDERDALANHMHTLCNMGEHPQARMVLRGAAVPRIEEIIGLSVDFPQLHSAALKAMAVIQWVPGES